MHQWQECTISPTYVTTPNKKMVLVGPHPRKVFYLSPLYIFPLHLEYAEADLALTLAPVLALVHALVLALVHALVLALGPVDFFVAAANQIVAWRKRMKKREGMKKKKRRKRREEEGTSVNVAAFPA